MKRTVISLIVAFVLLALCGTAELIVLKNSFAELNKMLGEMLIKADNKAINEAEFQSVVNYWEEMRPVVECIATHGDLNEINMRLNECMSFIHNEDYEQAYMQIKVLLFLSDYIPNLFVPNITTIL